MALWQYHFCFLPARPFIERYGALPELARDDDFATAWAEQPRADFTMLIERFAAPYSSWSSNIRMWGAEDSHRLHVVYEGEKVVEVNGRLSLCEPMAEFAAGVVSLAIDCDWILVLTADVVVRPDVAVLRDAVVRSNAAKFVTNPTDFIDGLRSGKYQPE